MATSRLRSDAYNDYSSTEVSPSEESSPGIINSFVPDPTSTRGSENMAAAAPPGIIQIEQSGEKKYNAQQGVIKHSRRGERGPAANAYVTKRPLERPCDKEIVHVTAEKEIMGEWLKIPCLDNLGS